MMAHVHSTGDHAYPPQDPAELRAQSLADARERIFAAGKRWRDATERRIRLTYDHTCDFGQFTEASVVEAQAGEAFDVVLSETFRAIREDMERAEVPAIHERRGA